MDNYSAQVAKIVGISSPGTWSASHAFFPEEDDKKEKRGSFFVVFCLTGVEKNIESMVIGREILSRLNEEYYGELETRPMRKLIEAVEKVSMEFTQGDQKVEIVAGSIVKDILYTTIFGGGGFWVKRGNLVQQVLSGEKRLEKASGFLKEGDVLLLGTSIFFGILPPGIIRNSLIGVSPEEIVETLTPLIYGKDNEAGVAVMIGRVEKEIMPETFDSVEIEPPKSKEIIIEETFIPLPRGESPIENEVPRTKGILFALRSKISGVDIEDLKIRNYDKDKGRRVAVTVAFVLIFLLIVSLVLGTETGKTQVKESKYSQIYSQMKNDLEEGNNLVNLDSQKAKTLFFRAKSQLGELEGLQLETEKTQEIKDEIERSLKLVVKEWQINDVPTYFDLGLIKENAQGVSLSLSQNLLVILDKSGSRIFGVDLQKKSGEVIAATGMPSEPNLIAITNDSVYALGTEGISKTNRSTKKTEIIIKKDSSWGDVRSLNSFGGNLYLLDSGGNAIWRYQGATGGKVNWLKETVVIKQTSMTIDGSIWVLNESGKIIKYIQGVTANYSQTGFDGSISKLSIIYTNENLEKLYVLDKENKKIVVFSKTGEFKGQYLWDGLGEISDFVVQESLGKIYLLKSNKILTIDLQ